jgi:hypothetical protein
MKILLREAAQALHLLGRPPPTKNYLDYYGDHYDTKIVPWLKSIGKIPEPISDVQSDLDRGHPAAGMYASLRRQFAAEVSDATQCLLWR